jgi:hypothetical protein
MANQLVRERGQSVDLALSPAVFNRHAAAFDKTSFAQALAKRGRQEAVSALRRFAIEPSNYRPRRLLPARRKRPRGRRAAEQSNEAAPFQLIEFRQALPFGRLAAYRRAVTKSGLVAVQDFGRAVVRCGQNEKPPFSGLCQLRPAADITPQMLISYSITSSASCWS